MRFRKLRIAWAVAWGLMAVLLKTTAPTKSSTSKENTN
jgi:hypothetical protein